jgi:hypothetical protein
MFVWREGNELLEATRPIRYFSANIYHFGQSETIKSLKCTTRRKESDKEKPRDAQEYREHIHTFYSRSRNNLRLPARHKQISNLTPPLSHASLRLVSPSAAAEAKGFPEHHPIVSRHNAGPTPVIINAFPLIGQDLSISTLPTLTSHEALLRSYCLFHLSARLARLFTHPRQ